MGLFDKFKNAIGNKIAGVKDKTENKIVGAVMGEDVPVASYSTPQSSGGSYTPQVDAEYEAKMEAMRKQKEMRAMELEMQMQERMMAQGGLLDQVVGAQAGVMNAATQALNEQNKKGGN
jgi:hypothetical protein